MTTYIHSNGRIFPRHDIRRAYFIPNIVRLVRSVFELSSSQTGLIAKVFKREITHEKIYQIPKVDVYDG